MGTKSNRAIAAATAAAIALTSMALTPATAASVSRHPAATSADVTDFSGARRHRGYARGNQAAGAAILGIIGAVGAYAAAREYRKAQERRYYGGYGYYDAPQSYYGRPSPYYYGY